MDLIAVQHLLPIGGAQLGYHWCISSLSPRAASRQVGEYGAVFHTTTSAAITSWGGSGDWVVLMVLILKERSRTESAPNYTPGESELDHDE